MTTNITPNAPDSDEFVVHWAQWFAITYWRLLNTPADTDERRAAFNLHNKAGQSLIHSTGITPSEVNRG